MLHINKSKEKEIRKAILKLLSDGTVRHRTQIAREIREIDGSPKTINKYITLLSIEEKINRRYKNGKIMYGRLS